MYDTMYKLIPSRPKAQYFLRIETWTVLKWGKLNDEQKSENAVN